MARIFKFELGAQARDTVTGFEGTITGRCEYMTGCLQYCIKPKINDKGEMVEGEWIDEIQVEIIKPAKVAAAAAAPGGPQADAPSG